MDQTMNQRIEQAPSVKSMERMGYCMAPTVSIHILYKRWTTPIWVTWEWNASKEVYESNPTRNQVTSTKTRKEMADYLEGLIHNPEVASFEVKWGCWGDQLENISGWYDRK